MIPAKFRSRKFIMSLASAVVGLVVVFVPEHSGTVEGVVTQVAGLIVMLGSVMGWVVAEAAVDKEREKRLAVESNALSNERTAIRYHESANSSRSGDSNIDGRATVPALIALVAAAGMVVGCAANGKVVGDLTLSDISNMTPERVYYTQVGTFNDAVATAIRAKQAGLISQDVYDRVVYPAIQTVDGLLDEANKARLSGDDMTFRDYARQVMVQIDLLILKVRPIQEQIENLGREQESSNDESSATDRGASGQLGSQDDGSLPFARVSCHAGDDRSRRSVA